MKKIVVPILIVLFGICWLLAEYNIYNFGQLIWTLGLLSAGILVLTYLGFNKSTFVIGSMLILGAGMSLLRYNGYITVSKELPILVIMLGVLMVINTTKIIPSDKGDAPKS